MQYSLNYSNDSLIRSGSGEMPSKHLGKIKLFAYVSMSTKSLVYNSFYGRPRTSNCLKRKKENYLYCTFCSSYNIPVYLFFFSIFVTSPCRIGSLAGFLINSVVVDRYIYTCTQCSRTVTEATASCLRHQQLACPGSDYIVTTLGQWKKRETQRILFYFQYGGTAISVRYIVLGLSFFFLVSICQFQPFPRIIYVGSIYLAIYFSF